MNSIILEISVVVTVLCTLVLQAIFPSRRVSLVLIGATASTIIVVVSRNASIHDLYNAVPFDVILILIGLGLFTSLMSRSNMFGLLALKIVDMTQGVPLRVLLVFSVAMFITSAFVNNITAICIMLPIMLVVMSALGVTQKFLSLFLALIITATNLGGAASPIGDFPAILLFSDSEVNITFLKYLSIAGTLCFIALLINIAVFSCVFMTRCKLTTTPASRILSVKTSHLLYRNVKANNRILIPGLIVFGVMLCFWAWSPKSWNLTPDVVCLGGVSIFMGYLLFFVNISDRNSDGFHLVEHVIRKETDVESIIFLGALFFMVASVGSTGFLDFIGHKILMFKETSPCFAIIIFLLVTGILTAVFSAGPSMGAMLPIAKQLALSGGYPEHVIYIGLALSVCAGSSFFLTAATSGPLVQSIVERSKLKTIEGEGTFGFWNFLPYGIISFVIIESVVLVWVCFNIDWRL